MKRFSWILTVPLIFVAAVFFIANREPIVLDFWAFELLVPLYVILLACVAFGLVVGGVATWLSAAPARRRARQARRRVAELERERQRAASAAIPPADGGRPGLPAPTANPASAAGSPEPGKRSALGR